MTESDRVICDGCGRDITFNRGYNYDYRLRLESVTMPDDPAYDGAVVDVLTHPAISSPADFCNLRCLRDWIQR